MMARLRRSLVVASTLAPLAFGLAGCSSSPTGWVAGGDEPSGGGHVGMAAYLSWTGTGGDHVKGTLVTPAITNGCEPVSSSFTGSIKGDGVGLLVSDGERLTGTISDSRLVLSGLSDYPPVVFRSGSMSDYDALAQKYCG